MNEQWKYIERTSEGEVANLEIGLSANGFATD